MSKLYFGCTVRFESAWPSARTDFPPPPAALEAFRSEEIHLLSTRFEKDRLQALIEIKDSVAPSFLMQRLKGRLSYYLKRSNSDFPGFSRHFFVRSLGQNTKTVVSKYIQSQVDRSDLVDPLFRNRMKELRFRDESEVLSTKTRHQGVYDLFAHLLLRWPQGIPAVDLLEGIKRESGKMMRRTAFWNAGGYVGSVGPYPLNFAMTRNSQNGWVDQSRRIPHSS